MSSSEIVIEISKESRRGCGYRKAGDRGFGIYLCGSMSWAFCDRLPFPFEINGDHTETISEYVKKYLAQITITEMISNANYRGRFRFSRQLQKVDLRKLFDKNLPTYCNHNKEYYTSLYSIAKRDKTCGLCYLCNPDDRPAYIEWIGKEFYKTTSDYITETRYMGISRKIAHIPKEYVPGRTVILLAHVDGFSKDSPGIFLSAMPQKIDVVVDTEKPEEIPEDALKIKEKYGDAVRFVKVIKE